jgi:hypothetical protein
MPLSRRNVQRGAIDFGKELLRRLIASSSLWGLPGISDLAQNEPFVPEPALAHVEPSKPLKDCGPWPPRLCVGYCPAAAGGSAQTSISSSGGKVRDRPPLPPRFS